MTTDKNPPAFPGAPVPMFDSDGPCGYEHAPGMSLRDWFAGMALNSMTDFRHADDLEPMAAHSYEMADAMLEARSK